MPTKPKAPLAFSARTFTYFDQAAKHATDRAWYEEHKLAFADYVQVPFAHLLAELREELQARLPGIPFSERKISKPVRRASAPVGEAVVHSKCTAFLQQPATSMFEQNPGIYFSFGAQDDDNLCGVGMYEPSGRQIKRLRAGATDGFDVIDKCLRAPALKKRWGKLAGERYTRFPKGYDEAGPASEYLWHRKWFLSKHFTRAQVTSVDFVSTVVADVAAAVPFLEWTRSVVGVYQRPAPDAAANADRLR